MVPSLAQLAETISERAKAAEKWSFRHPIKYQLWDAQDKQIAKDLGHQLSNQTIAYRLQGLAVLLFFVVFPLAYFGYLRVHDMIYHTHWLQKASDVSEPDMPDTP
ncbi:MAG: hypothetical protein WAK31_03955 [Chthoniobacterales bacterium]